MMEAVGMSIIRATFCFYHPYWKLACFIRICLGNNTRPIDRRKHETPAKEKTRCKFAFLSTTFLHSFCSLHSWKCRIVLPMQAKMERTKEGRKLANISYTQQVSTQRERAYTVWIPRIGIFSFLRAFLRPPLIFFCLKNAWFKMRSIRESSLFCTV